MVFSVDAIGDTGATLAVMSGKGEHRFVVGTREQGGLINLMNNKGQAVLIAGTASRLKGIVCNIRRLNLSPPMKSGPGTDKLSGCLERQAAAVLGGPVWVYGVPYVANSHYYAALGIPTVLYGAGPATREEARLGGPDERLILDDLRKATEVVALALAEFLTPAA